LSRLAEYLSRTDAVGAAVVWLLVGMSVVSWALMLWKLGVLRQARRALSQGPAIFWDAPSLTLGRSRLQAIDRHGLLMPLVDAACAAPPPGTLASQAPSATQVTRGLREALHASAQRLQAGQAWLASVGSTAPFVGLFGTVWGVYHALSALSDSAGFSLERIAAPVGEALIMTAAGLAVAVPAVLAYNLLGRRIAEAESGLEGFAHDLREMRLAPSEAEWPAEAMPEDGGAPRDAPLDARASDDAD
jgi:biopolymer transport protein ExbB